MSHKADVSFFDEKRPWSTRKDRILGSYLRAYLPKIATQKHPVLLVDGFAGPGKFGDGEAGSPLIICQAVRSAKERGLSVPVRFMCIESDPDLFRRLKSLMAQFDFADAKQGRFNDHTHEIEQFARDHSTFLYIDPWTVEGLLWTELDLIFHQLQDSRMSVEVLLNWNSASFVRRGLGAMSRQIPEPDPEAEDLEEVDARILAPPSLERLDEVIGTSDWRKILSSDMPFCEMVASIADLFADKLRSRFAEVCRHAMLALPTHTIPKYYLVFASRHAHALRLMNDEMVKSRKTLAEMAKPREPTLFETRSFSLVPDIAPLNQLVKDLASRRQSRGDLIASVVRSTFGQFSSSEIRGVIESLLKAGKLQSATGRSRINDQVEVWKTPERTAD
ncbi:MAG: three-Cys-motif partner protein TcmP [Planctomycetota bacterium]|nr:three-Cys-motif partner protein TcmP [Planctomycetota bacterium]